MNSSATPDVIDAFARSCESLNDFARDLRKRHSTVNVRTGADIRKYQNGWRLEKYVEADVDPNAGKTAAWWLELGWADDTWMVSSNVNVSHTDIHIELPVRHAKDAAELQAVLEDTISQLIGMAHEDNPFAVAIGDTLRD
jgi:hypothetical protein